MMKTRFLAAGALVASAAGLLACGDDTVVAPPDAGPDGSVVSDATAADSGSPDVVETVDSSLDADAAETAPPPPTRLLLSFNGASQSELVAFGLASHAVDGRLQYPDFIGTTATTPSSPFLLEQSLDVVARLDPLQPWVVRSSWSVKLDDAPDAGLSAGYADPVAIVTGAGSKAYVLRYTRNLIAVLDTSADVDGGAPAKTIDLSSQVQAGGDGYVEMTAGWFDPKSNYLYVLLANIDRNNVGCSGYCLLCSPTTPTLVAIDTSTDQLVDLGADAGSDAGGLGIALPGYSPAFGPTAMVYDPAGNRLLVLQGGCTTTTADGGTGPVAGREVDSVSLTTGAATKLLDLSSAGYASAIYYLDAHHVVLQLDQTYVWDPTTTKLGAPIANAPESFALDAKGNLVGISPVVGADGGTTGAYQVVSVSPPDGGATPLGSQDPFYVDGGDGGNAYANGFPSGAQLWPAP
jgi:hypothetical protein